MSDLQPPRINTQDPGAHELGDSSDDHFSSASEGSSSSHHRAASASSDNPTSPIPVTRVERVDDKALHGEIPGTPAYSLRTQDAVPDEMEIVPEGQRPRSNTRGRAMSHVSEASGSGADGGRPSTPGGTPVPRTVVEKVDARPSYGEVEGTVAHELRREDAVPDEVREAPEEAGRGLEGRSGSRGQADGEFEAGGEVEGEERQAWFRSMWEGGAEEKVAPRDEDDEDGIETTAQTLQNDNEDDNDFGDDFDDFAEGEEGNDDFGDFDDGVEDEATIAEQEQPQPQHTQPPAPNILAGLPNLDLSNLSPTDTSTATSPYLSAIFPNTSPTTPTEPSTLTNPPSLFPTPRSLSLMQQLLSPPPLAPPNWTRSRIRRLFLVSLGVPVDLDEILPPSKQKRLVLPNINLPSRDSPRPSTNLERVRKEGGNDSTTSINSKTGASKSASKTSAQARKGPPPPPDWDANSAARVAATTGEALEGLDDAELRTHVEELGALVQRGKEVETYWTGRFAESVKEKEALEGVVENLIGFVKGRREGGGGGSGGGGRGK